jgi:hypothetical protein
MHTFLMRRTQGVPDNPCVATAQHNWQLRLVSMRTYPFQQRSANSLDPVDCYFTWSEDLLTAALHSTLTANCVGIYVLWLALPYIGVIASRALSQSLHSRLHCPNAALAQPPCLSLRPIVYHVWRGRNRVPNFAHLRPHARAPSFSSTTSSSVIMFGNTAGTSTWGQPQQQQQQQQPNAFGQPTNAFGAAGGESQHAS